MLGLFERIKLRIPGLRKAENRLPVLSYQQIDESAREELVDEAIEQRLANLEELDSALRSLN
jgi:hypothetical protein